LNQSFKDGSVNSYAWYFLAVGKEPCEPCLQQDEITIKSPAKRISHPAARAPEILPVLKLFWWFQISVEGISKQYSQI